MPKSLKSPEHRKVAISVTFPMWALRRVDEEAARKNLSRSTILEKILEGHYKEVPEKDEVLSPLELERLRGKE